MRDGTLTRARFQKIADNAQLSIDTLLECGVALELRGVSGACADMLAHKDARFTALTCSISRCHVTVRESALVAVD